MTRRPNIIQNGLRLILALLAAILVAALLIILLLILIPAGSGSPPPDSTTVVSATDLATSRPETTSEAQNQATRLVQDQATVNAQAQATGQAFEHELTPLPDEPPTATPTVLPSPVAIDETAEAVRLGEMAVERPFAMIQGASASWVVEMYIPEQFTSLEMPTGVEFVQVGLSEPPEAGALYSTDRVALWLSRYMQVELRVPAGFTLNGPPTVWKEINLDSPRPYVVWEWLLTAPDRPGSHEILLNIYQAQVAPNTTESAPIDTRQRAIPPRRYKIEVVPYTPTPVPVITPVPTPVPATATPIPTMTPAPFFDRPGTTAAMGALATIVAAIIGVVGVLAAKDRLPLLTKGQQRRSLAKQISEKTRRLNLLKERQARQGFFTDPAVLAEIQDIEADLARLEQLQNEELEE
ncbi:MAG: hypothetical protein KDI79_01000 [Anaerolineae bacterium]|nr:hypothetical protein [Anaerolineae bacterium]